MLTAPGSDKPKTMDPLPTGKLRWYTGLTGYHWWVLAIGSFAWLFDTMDQRLFVLSRQPALAQLLNVPADDPAVLHYGKLVTAVMIVGTIIGESTSA